MLENKTDSQLIVDHLFGDFEEFSESIQGWDFEMRQLTPGKSPIGLLQFGRPEFMLSRFYFEQSYEQHGTTPPDTLTFGFCEENVDEVTTPYGVVQQDNIFCFPANDEMLAISRPQFKGGSLSIAEPLIDEVAETCGLQRIKPSKDTMRQVVRCNHENMTTLRQALRNFITDVSTITPSINSAAQIHNREFELIQHLILTIAGSQPTDRIRLTDRKQMVLQRAVGYIEANANEPITVLELAQASGCCVRTLEYVFRDYFSVTPKSYLKSQRLVAARSDLSKALDTQSSINEIASRWGFWHMSQFATDYRRFFGELPSETLNRTHKVKN